MSVYHHEQNVTTVNSDVLASSKSSVQS